MRSAGIRPSFRVALRAAAGRRSLPPAGGRDVSDRRARRHPGRLRRAPAVQRSRARHCPRGTAIIAAATVAAGIPAGRRLWGCGSARLPRLSLPLAAALASFAAAAAALAWAMPRMATNPLLAAAVLAGVTTVDLAYNNGPSSSTAQPPAMYDVLEPDTRNATIAILKSKVVDNATRRDRIELAGLGFHWPNASLTHSPGEHARLQPAAARALQRGDGRRGPRRACPTSASSRRSSRPIARRWPTCWACASSPPARPSRPWTRA